MVEMKNSCDSCAHKSVCKYTEQFKKSKDDIMAVMNDHFEAYDCDGFVDLTIRCRQYIMAPYQEVSSKQNRTPLNFCYSDIQKADIEKIQQHNWEFPKPNADICVLRDQNKQEDK